MYLHRNELLKHQRANLLLNGTLDELLYERGRLVTGGLPFAELKQREHINPFAQTVGQSPEFPRSSE
jgi:hypothetical protein